MANSSAAASKSVDAHVGLKHNLQAALKPKTVAVVGATERDNAVGKTVLTNLMEANTDKNYEIYPINPTRPTICGLPAYKDVTLCPKKVDLAVVVTPAHTVKGVVENCGKAGVPVVAIISAGFKELGPEGEALENDVIAVARQYGVRIIGPNCLGVMNPNWGLNATFAACCARKGNVAFISQSGAMCTAMLDWSMKEIVGFSAFVSIGSMADLQWGDIVDYLGSEDETQLILMYMETIGNSEAFLAAAKKVAMKKPIIVIKAGQTEAAAAAAASHTGSLAGSHDAFLAAMQRVGVMVLDSIGEVLDVVNVLSKQPRPLGPRLAIVTNAGGPGVLATDATALFGAEVATLEQKTIEKLNTFLPSAWSHSNPVDVLGDANALVYAKTMEVVLEDGNIDGVLVVLSPQSVTEPHKTAEDVVAAYKKLLAKGDFKKPIICSWMGGVAIQSGYDLLNASGIPCILLPDAAAKAYAKIWQASKELQRTYMSGAPLPPTVIPAEKKAEAISIMKAAREQGRDILTEAESKLVLKAFGIPIAQTIVCATMDEAVKAGKEVRYPCVVKLNSETITHKSDVGGVKLNICSDEEIKAAWTSIKTNVDKIGPNHFQGVSVQPMIEVSKGVELLFGSFADVQFGPLVVFGAGGCMVEITRDRAIGLAPLDSNLASRQIENTRIYEALKGGHGERFPGVDLPALNKALVNFSHMVSDLSELMDECDINPMLALPDRLVALDARVVLKKVPTSSS